MIDQTALAYVNLNALLRNVEDIVALDAEAAALAGGRSETIAFVVNGGPTGDLSFGPQGCKFHGFGEGRTKATIGLFFPSPARFNAMVSGKGKPIPFKGFTRLGFLTKNFTGLAKRLETVLKADEASLADAALARANAELLLYAAGFALAEVGNWDPVGQLNAARIPDGIIEMGVEGGPALSITAQKGSLAASKGRIGTPRARMTFASLGVVRELFSGKADTLAILGEGSVAMSGYIPMIDHMNKVLGLVPRYLG